MRRLGLMFFAFLLFVPLFLQADQILPVNFPTIVERSEIIFQGVFKESEIVKKKGLILTLNRFQVKEVIKGQAAIEAQLDKDKFEFLQYGASNKDTKKMGMAFRVNFVEFEPGQEYVVCLSKESETLKVRSVVGFTQGLFDYIYDAQGKAQVVNKFSNKNLFQNLPATKSMSKTLKAGQIDQAQPPSGPIDYDNFKAMIKTLE
ncbi:MAG: hypothetical protein ABH859_01905 [Pseudomonadota bacterium]